MKKYILLLCVSLLSPASWSKTTVSGLSSGAYFAAQFHLANSSWVEGAAILAGGPYYCAKGRAMDALYRCMEVFMGAPSLNDIMAEANKRAAAGEIDDLENVKSHSIYLQLGKNDRIVNTQVLALTQKFYQALGVPEIKVETSVESGHAFPTVDNGNPCPAAAQSPYVSRCGRDIAGEMLSFLYGPLEPKGAVNPARFFKINQATASRAEALSLATEAIVYVPTACEARRSECHVHVAFHGCKQTIPEVQDAYYRQTGHNEWAETNNIVVIYPQVLVNNRLGNSQGCWDWWGYSGADYHLRKGGQMSVISELVQNYLLGVAKLKEMK